MMKVENIAERNNSEPAKVWQQLFEEAIRHVKGSSFRFLQRRLVHMNLARLAREARKKQDSIVPILEVAPSIDTKEYFTEAASPRSKGSLSPSAAHRGLATRVSHDLTERMIRRQPYLEKKVIVKGTAVN